MNARDNNAEDAVQQRPPPTKAQLMALWRTRLVELRRVIGRLRGIQDCIAERTGTHPWLPDLPDNGEIDAAITDGRYLNNIPWLEPSAEEVSHGTSLRTESARTIKRMEQERIADANVARSRSIAEAANVHYLSDHRSPQNDAGDGHRDPEDAGDEPSKE